MTGAEIKACCRPAAFLDLSHVQAAQHVVPLAVTSADRLGIDQRLKVGGTSRRRVGCDPSQN